LLKGANPTIQSFKTLLKPEAENAKTITDWLGQNKQAVLFTLESADPKANIACGYLFIDDLCFSVDYNTPGQFWQMLRVEPALAICHKGAVADLIPKVKIQLAEKPATPPTTQNPPDEKNAPQGLAARRKEIDEGLKKNRNPQAD
jgi:hypothetical protein